MHITYILIIMTRVFPYFDNIVMHNIYLHVLVYHFINIISDIRPRRGGGVGGGGGVDT